MCYSAYLKLKRYLRIVIKKCSKVSHLSSNIQQDMSGQRVTEKYMV